MSRESPTPFAQPLAPIIMDTVPPALLAQAPPTRLKYAYPPATKPIVNNIAKKLLEDPRFYMNVLHLMNKMDLPPPFTVRSLASKQPAMVTASMKTIDLQKAPNVAAIPRPMVEATVMTMVGTDHIGQQSSQELSQQGQKRKKTDDLLASDESEVESEPDEEQERKSLIAKIMQGVLSPNAKSHAHVGLSKDPFPKPVADDAANRNLDLEDEKETAGNAPLANDSSATTMDVDQETIDPKANVRHVFKKLPQPSKDNEIAATSGEKVESHELSKSQLKRMRKKQKLQEVGQRIESLVPAPPLSDALQKATYEVPVVTAHQTRSVEPATLDPSTTGSNPPPSDVHLQSSNAPEPIVLADLDVLMATKASQDVEEVSDQAPKEANENIHILNLDFKKTSRSDLANIFAHYFAPYEAILEPNIFKYFTKGKLRNQAFIRMPNTDRATLAIDQINGCLVHGRRIVVQYGLQRASDKQAM